MTREVKTAIKLATRAHRGQKDKCGRDYIRHPLDVMLAVPKHLQAAAVLHDVLEDTTLLIGEMLEAGIAHETVNLVLVLTRGKDEKYFDYIRRVNRNPQAVVIKLADIHDNTRPDRVTAETEGMSSRYEKALNILQGG